MSELAASSNAPIGGVALPGLSAGAAPAAAPAKAAAQNGNGAFVSLSDDDISKCTNCKTCYQDLPEIFEKTQIVANGATKEVAHMIPGALQKVKATPEIKSKVARVAANCDAEIIHEH